MDTDYGNEEILISKRLINNGNSVIVTCDRETPIESVEKQNKGKVYHVTENKDSNVVEYGEESEDLAEGSKFQKHFGGCLELECDEETITVKSELAENEVDLFTHAEVQSTGYCYGNLEVNGDESKFSEATSVINIAPILDHKSDSDADECDDCQVTSHSEGRINSGKRIKLEVLDSDDEKTLIQDVKCAILDKSSILDPVGSSNADRKPSDSPDSDDQLKAAHLEVIHSEPPSGFGRKLASKKNSVFGLRYLCTVCQKPFPEPLRKSQEFSNHLKSHFPSLYLCCVCGQVFTRKDNKERHLAFHKKRKIHHCHICGISFKSSKDVVKTAHAHMETHRIKDGGVRPVSEFLSYHVKMSKKHALPYSCNICATEFAELSQLLNHLVSHRNGRRHSCIVCAKECLWKADINMWMCKSHPDVCNICGVGNLTPETVAIHRKTHYGKFYNCEICNHGFTRQENLDKHVLSTHSRRKNGYSCHLCEDFINSQVKVYWHINCHNRTIFNDGLPDYFTAQIKKKSRRSSLFACNLCGYSSDQVQPLISHLLEHVRSSHACPDCGREYISPDGLKVHMGKRHVHDDIGVARRPKIRPQVHETVEVRPLVKEATQPRCRSQFKELHACPICEQEFFFSENLELHKKAVHHGKSLHPCHACDVSLPSNELTGHIKQFHRDFVIGIQVDVSSRLMTTLLYLICSICGSRYSRSHWNSILSHLLLHLNTRYSCYLCGKEFTQESHLTQHHNLQHGQHPVLEVNHPLLVEHPYCILPKALPKAQLEGVHLQVETP